jgi:hemerythrin
MRYIIENFKNSGDEKTLLKYLEVDLINWLVNHIQTMDTVTAMFFKTGLSPCAMQH